MKKVITYSAELKLIQNPVQNYPDEIENNKNNNPNDIKKYIKTIPRNYKQDIC